MRNKLKLKSSINNSFLDFDIIKKLESLEDYPGTNPLLLSDTNGKIIYFNKSSQKILQFKDKDNLFALNTEPGFEQLFSHLSKNNINSFCCDLVFERKDEYFEGYLLHIERLKLNEADTFIVYFDSQNNRKKLTQKFNTYNQALESVNVGILIADHNANIKFVSKSFEDIFKTRIENLYNKNIVSAFKKYLSEFETEELEFAVSENHKWVKVISDLSSEGDVNYMEVRLNITDDYLDGSMNYIITANDITKHIQQARLIKKSEQRQKSIIDNISDPILILRRERNNLILESANNNFYTNILGQKQENLEESLFELVNPVLHSIIHEAINIIEDRDRVHAPFHYTSPSSNKRFLGKITFTDDQYDNSRIYIVNMTDITEQLEVERKLREAYKKEISLNKLKSTFLANMSHEIRTPLNAIVGYSDLLEDDVKTMNYESSSKMTTYLKDGVNRLLKLVDNIVEVSLLDSGNEEFALDPINLHHFINENKSVWIEQAKLKGLAIEFYLHPTELHIEANEEKLHKAFNELVENAIKYNRGNGKITISTGMDKDYCMIELSDTGIGIEAEGLDKILKLFEQVEETGYTRKYEGAGLGLSLANKLISFMNGKMSIVSQPDEGTTITISFPKI